MAFMRGQAALEMFVAVTIALLLVFWLGNYAGAFSRTAAATGAASQQALIARQLASAFGNACALGVNTTMRTPCLRDGAEDSYYNVSFKAGENKFRVFNAVSNSTTETVTNCAFPSEWWTNVKCAETPLVCAYNVEGVFINFSDKVVAGECER